MPGKCTVCGKYFIGRWEDHYRQHGFERQQAAETAAYEERMRAEQQTISQKRIQEEKKLPWEGPSAYDASGQWFNRMDREQEVAYDMAKRLAMEGKTSAQIAAELLKKYPSLSPGTAQTYAQGAYDEKNKGTLEERERRRKEDERRADLKMFAENMKRSVPMIVVGLTVTVAVWWFLRLAIGGFNAGLIFAGMLLLTVSMLFPRS